MSYAPTALAVPLLALTACAEMPRAPDLAELYERAAEIQEARRPVITIPGILGSRLVDPESGAMIWGGTDRLSADPDDPREARLIALPIGAGDEPLRDLRDGLRTDGVVRTVRASILGLRVEEDIYSGVIETLIAGGYDFRETRAAEIEERQVNLDAFEFPYDWRRDIVEAVFDLDYFIERKADQVRAERERVLGDPGPPVKFDLVAHSMGALVARYYLMYGAQNLPEDGSLPELTWAGAEHVDRAVLIAPPFSGSALSLRNMVNGRSFGPFQPEYPPALLGTHPSLYQLMPRDRHERVLGPDGAPVELYDPETWARHGWGLLDPGDADLLALLTPDEPDDAARRARATRHLGKLLRRAERFHRAIDRPNVPPPWLDLFLVVGGGFATPAVARYDPVEDRMEIVAFEEGDGVVLRASSLADERQGNGEYTLGLQSPHNYRSILFLPDEHVELTQNPVFGDNLLFWLLEGGKVVDQLRVATAPDAPRPASTAPRRLVEGVSNLLIEGADMITGDR